MRTHQTAQGFITTLYLSTKKSVHTQLRMWQPSEVICLCKYPGSPTSQADFL